LLDRLQELIDPHQDLHHHRQEAPFSPSLATGY
jgi:hypothetical protein